MKLFKSKEKKEFNFSCVQKDIMTEIEFEYDFIRLQ